MFIEVAVPLPLNRLFTYRWEENPPRAGSRVLVSFGRRRVVGIALHAHREEARARVKPILEVLDPEPVLSPLLLALGEWISSYYLAPLGECLRCMLPPVLMRRQVAGGAGRRQWWPVRRRLSVLETLPCPERLTRRQSEVLEMLRGTSLPVPVGEFARRAGTTPALLQTLAARGAIRIAPLAQSRTPPASSFERAIEKYRLTGEQAGALQAIQERLRSRSFASLLLHGITGSGKTEVYLNAISRTLEQGRSALVLVPEIGLTPQTAHAFQGWFGERVALLHSGLSEGERFDEWRRIRSGQARVVVGTRSAVYAPLEKLGIIIVDEEHDGSYKQEESPRYHAREVALKRGQLEGAVVVLGTATPQLETFHRSRRQDGPGYLSLPTRVPDRALPQVELVDMREEFRRRGKSTILSEPLVEAIGERLAAGEQVLVLLNRRGWSRALLCRSCGEVETCRQCSISLTFHQARRRLVCHYCGHSRGVPRRCPSCGREYLHFLGEGTEQVEDLLKRFFPAAALARLDRDTARRKGSAGRILADFARGKTQLLVGTQMIAKGHDFPAVTLVGVLSAEQALRTADFRAAERTFQLVTQVAGRAGRGPTPGRVVIQSYAPEHYSLRCARAQDYRAFFDEEIRFRRRFRYPPFTALVQLLVQGSRAGETRELAERTSRALLGARRHLSSERRLRILGPAPAPISRLRGRYRFQILLKTTHRPETRAVVAEALGRLEGGEARLRAITVDVDPLNLL